MNYPGGLFIFPTGQTYEINTRRECSLKLFYLAVNKLKKKKKKEENTKKVSFIKRTFWLHETVNKAD